MPLNPGFFYRNKCQFDFTLAMFIQSSNSCDDVLGVKIA